MSDLSPIPPDMKMEAPASVAGLAVPPEQDPTAVNSTAATGTTTTTTTDLPNMNGAPDVAVAAEIPVQVPTTTGEVAVPLTIPEVPASGVQVVLPLEEFAEDLDLRLGRANGNIYQRKPGIDGVHDGQVMVRLKKKRFIVIDYGIVPNEQDLQAAAMNPNITVPLGAGVTKCTGKIPSEPGGPLVPCKKVGVPVLLYDSEPDQPPSLYLRSGLCFVCQRNLNEKRRTQRKRPSDRANQAAKVSANAQHSQAAFLAAHHQVGMAHLPPSSSQQLPGMQTVRIGGIGTQANLVGAGTTGRVNATPHHRVLMAVTNGHKKIKLAHTNQPLVLAPDAIILNGPPDNHSCKSVRTGHGFAEIGTDLNLEVHQSLQSTQSLLHSVNTPEMIQQGIPPPTPDEISRTYDAAFYSLSKSLYLLVQWKTSWDAAIASAMQQEAHIAQHQAQSMITAQPLPQLQLQSPPPPPTTTQAQQHTPPPPSQQQQQQHHPQQQPPPNAAALQVASMANAAATAAIGGMINGVPGSVPVGIPPMANLGQPPPMGVLQGVGEPAANLAQAVASAAAVAAVAQQPKVENNNDNNNNNKPSSQDVVVVDATSPALDQSVEV